MRKLGLRFLFLLVVRVVLQFFEILGGDRRGLKLIVLRNDFQALEHGLGLASQVQCGHLDRPTGNSHI